MTEAPKKIDPENPEIKTSEEEEEITHYVYPSSNPEITILF